MLLITGAGGKTGQALIRALAAKGETIRALVRRDEQAEAVQALGAYEVIAGDLLDEDAVCRAMEGVRSVYHIPPNVHPDEVAIGRRVIDAAREAGVTHFVYHSVLHPHTQAMPHHWNKLRVEEMLFESGLPFTILQPTAYMQNILAGWDTLVAESILRVPYPVDTCLSLVDLDDVAEAAADVLTELGHTRATYELVGTRALSQSEVAEILSQKIGRAVQAEAEPVEAWEKRARKTGMGEYQVSTLVSMFRYYERFGLWGNPNVLGWLLRRQPTSFPAFVERVARGAKWGNADTR